MAYNILVVDDSSIIRAVVKKTIKLAEVPVNELHEAENGQVGLDKLKENWVDLVFADINMPVMTGIEMVEKMAEDGDLKGIPVVIISTEGSKARIEELMKKGVKAYIRKPFTPEILRDVVKEVMGEESDGEGKERNTGESA